MLSHLFAKFITIDPTLGRLDPITLSDQANMEILVNALTGDLQRTIRDRNGHFTDVCEWYFVDCNDDEEVVKVNFKSYESGTLNLAHIPRNVVEFHARVETLTGTIDTEGLSHILQTFTVGHCDFHGTLEMKALPHALRYFDVSHNHFEGECDLTALPKNLQHLSAAHNQMTGTIRLDKLPENLSTLDLSENKFTGSIDLSQLPASLVRLSLSSNTLSGEISLESLPSNLSSLAIAENNFLGEFRMREKPASLRRLFASENAFVGTAVIPRDAKRFYMGSNFLTSVVDEFGVQHSCQAEILAQQRAKAVE